LSNACEGRSRSRGPKKDPSASSNDVCYYCRKLGHIKKNYFKHKKDVEEGGKNTYGASTKGKSKQASVVEEADENPCDVLTAQSGKRRYSNALLLNSRCTYHVSKKRSSTYTSLSMEAQS